MTDIEQRQFLSALRAKEEEVGAALRRRDGLDIQATADVFDQIQDALDRALVVQNLDRGSEILREVRQAEERIANGEYGSCLGCGQTINPKRLAALPWAALCLPCQEKEDVEKPIGNPRLETWQAAD